MPAVHPTAALTSLSPAIDAIAFCSDNKRSVFERLARLVIPQSLLRANWLVADPRAGQVLRHLEALGYRVQVERSAKSAAPQNRKLTISVESDWAHQRYVVSAAIGKGDEEYACARELALKVAIDLEE